MAMAPASGLGPFSIRYPATATVYCALGLARTALIAMHWRSHVWRLQAAANAR
jgi:hypothetical protein